MKYTSIFLSASLLLCPYLKAQDQVDPSEVPEITLGTPDTTEAPTDEHGHQFAEKELTKEEHLESIVNNFFAILHAPHNLHDAAHHFAHIFSSIMHLAIGLLKQDPANKNYVATLDENAQKRIAELIAKKTREYRSIIPMSPMPIQIAMAELNPQKEKEEKDDEAQVVLSNFAEIVGKFFEIVKDPENPANVAQNIAGMIGNMINIAAQATKMGKLSAEESELAISTYINNMDELAKTKMINMILRRQNTR